MPLHSQTCPALLAGVLTVSRQILTTCPLTDLLEPLILLYELCIKLTGQYNYNSGGSQQL